MKPYSLLLVLLACNAAFANGTQDEHRQYTAVRITAEPRVDGKLDDAAWIGVPVATDFTQFVPNPGEASNFNTEVKVIYSDNALFVAARMYDSEPQKISRVLSQRDDLSTADYFMLGLDPFHDRQNGLRFIVTAAGVQADMKVLPWSMDGAQVDLSWDAVWESAVSVDGEGWSVEMKIPYSALRFPKKDEQTWGLQFSRYVNHQKELATWNTVNPKVNGMCNQWGDLTGIKNIHPPLRLSLSPYVAAYFERTPESLNPLKMSNRQYVSGGLDLKYGITESFTLDATLVPDFGQVQSDNVVLNLSPFEVQYEEHRPFFTEGTELFNKGGLFYSRRIGGTPHHFYDLPYLLNDNDVIDKNPSQVQLYNAAKLSGRTAGGLGIGLFNAVAAPAYATVHNTVTGETRQIQTDALTNYNLLVFDQTLHNNSSVSFTNANTLRRGSARDANVSAMGFHARDKKNVFDFNGMFKISYLNDAENNLYGQTGYAYSIGLSKVSGNFNFDLIHSADDKRYDPNDMGIQFTNNQMSEFIGVKYNVYTPHAFYQQYGLWLGNEIEYRLSPRAYESYKPNFGFNVTLNNNWNINLFNQAAPNYYDYYEPRVDGRKFNQVPYIYSNLSVSTDPRKHLYTESNFEWAESPRYDDPLYAVRLMPVLRLNDRWTISHETQVSLDKGNYGFVFLTMPDTVYMGRRKVNKVVNTFSTAYTFSPHASLTLRARHYWTRLRYDDYYFLNLDGSLTDVPFDSIGRGYDTNFNAFNVDAVFTWQFAAGSFVTVTWKNSIFQSDHLPQYDYFDNVHHTLDAPQSNQFSVKMIYYLDYVKMKGWVNKAVA